MAVRESEFVVLLESLNIPLALFQILGVGVQVGKGLKFLSLLVLDFNLVGYVLGSLEAVQPVDVALLDILVKHSPDLAALLDNEPRVGPVLDMSARVAPQQDRLVGVVVLLHELVDDLGVHEGAVSEHILQVAIVHSVVYQ